MLIKALVSILIMTNISATSFAGDFGPGNGGDLAHCKASNDNSFNGLYSLDYLLTFNRRNNNDDIVKIENWELRKVAFVCHLGPYQECGTAWDRLCT